MAIPLTILVLLGCFCVGCGNSAKDRVDGGADSGDASAVIPIRIESRDRIVSEDGELQLVDGLLAVRSLSLLTATGTVPLLGALVLDLTRDDQEIALAQPTPAASYRGIAVEFGAAESQQATLRVRLRSDTHSEEVTARYRGDISGAHLFPQGPIELSADLRIVALKVRLTQMFFYLYPYTDAVDGHYELTSDHVVQLTSNLVYMLELELE